MTTPASSPKPPVRIGNAQAFWGDRSDAAAEMLARVPDLDYLTMDYLAEVSMSILAAQRDRNPDLGYPEDFLDVVRSLAPYWGGGGRCRLIANAGGLNPLACAKRCAAILEEAGCRPLTIAVVTGDSVLPLLKDRGGDSKTFRNLDTGEQVESVRDRLVTANAYLGAESIVAALDQGADIVITGRVADPSLAVAPCLHHFGWKGDDWDRLAGATVAGHLIECGTHVTGGISTDWLSLPDPANIGFPIVEVSEDGSCVVTKPPGTGGRVTELTVKEQLLYEIGDPGRYLSPDVTVSFLGLSVEDLGQDRVRVRGARGTDRPGTLKVSATYRDGYRAAGMLTIVGEEAVAKARRAGEVVLDRVRRAGHELRSALVECLGAGDVVHTTGSDASSPMAGSLRETVLRISVESATREGVERFTRELIPLVTAGPPGTTGYAEGRPRVHPVIRYWPCLVSRDRTSPAVEFVRTNGATPVAVSVAKPVAPVSSTKPSAPSTSAAPEAEAAPMALRTLSQIACVRSGDKGTGSNVGVIARTPLAYERLRRELTVERIQAFYAPQGVESVERFELPNLGALNFLLHGVLRNSLRTDVQGKALAQALLEFPLGDEATSGT